MNFIEFIFTQQGEIIEQTGVHIGLTVVALAIAILIGLPLGIILTRYKKFSPSALGVIGIIQTIPSIALLGFLLPLLGIGVTPAIVALFLYALLPIVRNTYTGIEEVDPAVREAARGMGMSDLQILVNVELPLAVPVIFAGIRTATVINVGVATLCALIGAGGLGAFIFRGIALNNVYMILAGAIPAAILALLFDMILGLLQKFIRPLIKPILILSSFVIFVIIPFIIVPSFFVHPFTAGFTAEFMERSDGYPGLKKHYNLSMNTVELDPGLMYYALKEKSKIAAMIKADFNWSDLGSWDEAADSKIIGQELVKEYDSVELYVILRTYLNKREQSNIEETIKQHELYERYKNLNPRYSEVAIPLKEAKKEIDSSDIIYSSKYNIFSNY